MDNISVGVEKAAELLGLSKVTLARMRRSKQGPAWAKVGKRVLYPVSGLYAWIHKQADAQAFSQDAVMPEVTD